MKIGRGRTDGTASERIEEEQLAIEYLREQLVQVNARIFTAEAKDVLASDPADRVDKAVVVLVLGLIGKRRGPNLEA